MPPRRALKHEPHTFSSCIVKKSSSSRPRSATGNDVAAAVARTEMAVEGVTAIVAHIREAVSLDADVRAVVTDTVNALQRASITPPSSSPQSTPLARGKLAQEAVEDDVRLRRSQGEDEDG